jgi:pyrroline-5-carboxylate reductase
LLIAVKPAKVLATLEEIKASIKDGALVVSVAAGVTTESMEQAIGPKASVIRAMPNTPSIVGHGVTGIAKGESANDNQLALAKDLFETVGQVIVVDEEKINALSTISGSGPAYVFYFAEKLITAAKELGFTQKEADQMVRATFLGSATLLAASSETPEALRAQVTSPNGTTMEATNTFDAYNVEGTIQMATRAALARAIELGKNK